LKVRDIANNSSGIPNLPVRDDAKASAGKKTDFRNELERAEEVGYEQQLEEIVKGIVSQGEKLGKKFDIRELMSYKKMISEFLELALGKSRKFTKQNLLDRRGRHKVYALIKKIDNELCQLTEDVINGEKDNIETLRRLDDIRGLILDMML
jgi:uncharacterized protein YaaR (DUF327 family)